MSIKEETCVVIPAYQAERSIRPLVEKIVSQNLHVIVVDDASTDRTVVEAEKGGAAVLRRVKNGGKGITLRDGFAEALKKNYSWILAMDADGQHLPEEIPLFLQAASDAQADLILGDRMSHPIGMPFNRRVTNQLMSALLSGLIHQKILDSQCGYRLISRRILGEINLTSSHYEIESEMLVKTARAGFRISSVPISSVYEGTVSFIRPFRDTIRFLAFLKSVR